jgi:hypothetical protein
MTDQFIDLDETQIYGPYASAAILALAVGQVPAFDGGMKKLATEIDHATVSVGQITKTARKASAEVRAGTKAKGPALAQAVALLGRFSKHLDSHPAGSVDRKLYFPEDGTAGGVGHGAARVLLALGRINVHLKDPSCELKSKADWSQEIEEATQLIAPAIQHSNNAKTERRAATPELEAARQAWLQVYTAAKCGVECVLRLSGNLHLMQSVFFDLTVPANTKVTQAPPVPPSPTSPATPA